jgi:ubiquinone/menaquinone biosynthesis C-methylase UbiE
MKFVSACVLVTGLLSLAPAPNERSPFTRVEGPVPSERTVFARVEGQQQRDPVEYAKLLEGAERVEKLQVPRVIEALGVKPGMKVADIGSGSGLFTRPIASSVAPGGTVYAVDIDSGLLALVERRARDAKIDNIVTVVGAPDDPKLPEPVDVIFICDTLHHIDNRGAYLKNLRRHLRPGGRIAIIDFATVWPDGHEPMRFSVAELEGWMREAGFVRAASHDWLDNSFFVVYR